MTEMSSFCKASAEDESTETYDDRRSPMEKLPSELKEKLASFLSTREVLNLAECSKSVTIDFNFCVATSSLTDRVSQSKKYRSEAFHCFAVIIPPKEAERTHSMTFTCKVKHYGFGDDAKLCIVEQRLEDRVQEEVPGRMRSVSLRHGETIVNSSTRNKSFLSLSFPIIQPNKFYQLYIRTPGYDHDEYVRFSDMRLHRMGFDTKSTEYKAYQFDVYEQGHGRYEHTIHGDFK